MSSLYIVATPIGNLEDITLRALRILKEADFILCEDTRVTQKLLSRYSVATPTISYHQHSEEKKYQEIAELLEHNKNLALVTDSGTPGISDPGNELIAFLLEQKIDVRVVPVPGPSALAAAASVAGIPMDKFLFLGFPPHKKGRKTFFAKAAQSEIPVILYESPFRIQRTLRELTVAAGEDRPVVMCRELTKKFETIYRGTLQEFVAYSKKEKALGEYVVIVDRIQDDTHERAWKKLYRCGEQQSRAQEINEDELEEIIDSVRS